MARYSEHILSEYWDDFNAGAPDPIDTDQSIAEPIRRFTSSFQTPTPGAARERARQRVFGSLLDTEENTMSATTPVIPFPGADWRPSPGSQSWLPDVFVAPRRSALGDAINRRCHAHPAGRDRELLNVRSVLCRRWNRTSPQRDSRGPAAIRLANVPG